MAGFSSQDSMINAITELGQSYRSDWQKSTFATTAHTAGLWYSLFRGGGNPDFGEARGAHRGEHGDAQQEEVGRVLLLRLG